MSEFLHEGVRYANRGKRRRRHYNVLRTPVAVSRDAPRSTSTVNAKARKHVRADDAQLLHDMHGELTRLRQWTGKLAPRRQRMSVASNQDSRTVRRAEQRAVRVRRIAAVTVPAVKNMTVTASLPAYTRARRYIPVVQPPLRAVASTSRLIPAHALRPHRPGVEPLMQAAHALRPHRPGVEPLMQAARARRSGRLPFVPRAKRVRAQQLLSAVFSKSVRVPRIAASRRAQQAAAVVAAQPRAEHQAGVTYSAKKRPRGAVAYGVPRSTSLVTPRPLDAADLPRLAATIPSFQTTGVAAPSMPTNGSYIAETNEDVHVITRNDRPIASSSELAASNSARESIRAPRAVGGRVPTVPAAAAGSATAGGGATSAGTRAGGGPQQISGTLRITGTEGLNSWISKVEGKLSRG